MVRCVSVSAECTAAYGTHVSCYTDMQPHCHHQCVPGLQRIGGGVVGQQARSHSSKYGTVKSRDRRWNEPVFADQLLGLEAGALGQTLRQPYWAARKAISQAYLSRLALRAGAPNATTSHPELDLTHAHPLALKAISALVQLSFHRYSAVAARAARAISGLMPLSSSLALCLLPVLSSRLALMDPNGGGPGAVPEEVTAEGGYQIPVSNAAAEELLETHTKDLDGLIGVVERQGGSAERCTSDNKHLLLGALGLLETLRGHLSMAVSLNPSALTTVFLSMMLLQSYSLLVCLLLVVGPCEPVSLLQTEPSL